MLSVCRVVCVECVRKVTNSSRSSNRRSGNSRSGNLRRGRSSKPRQSQPTSSSWQLALANDGKLSAARSLFLSGWLKDRGIDICFVSEAAHPARSELPTEPEYQWAAPLDQRKGGSGFLMRCALAEQCKIKITQAPDYSWSIAVWRAPCRTALVSIYLTPPASRNPVAVGEFLSALDSATSPYAKCIIGGDFNAATGTPQRGQLNDWMADRGFHLVNPAITTHMMSATHRGSDLDLCFARQSKVALADCIMPSAGHARQVFTVANSSLPGETVRSKKIAWRKLNEPSVAAKYRKSVAAQVARAVPLRKAILRSANETVGYARDFKRTPLPRSARQKVRKLRQKAKKLNRGTPEHLALILEVGAILRRFRIKAWKKKVRRLAETAHVSQECWQLVKNLRRTAVTARGVGIPDDEVARAYEEVYGSNKTQRPDWTCGRPRLLPDELPCLDHNNVSLERLDEPFTAREVCEALQQLPNRKAPGVDGIPHEALKALSTEPAVIKLLQQDASRALKHGYGYTTVGRLVTIPKKEAPTDPLKMRPLMMLPTSRKLLERLVANRLIALAKVVGHDGLFQLQGGFRQGISLERQLLLAQIAIHDANYRCKPLRIVALDLVKAFDKVPKEFAAHCAVSYVSRKCPTLARLIHSLTLSPLHARIGTEKFPVRTGVPQGGILSPWLFVMVMNDLGLRIGDGGYSLTDGTILGTLLYADDILLLDKDSSESEIRCQLARGWVEEWGGQIHPGKTQVLSINCRVTTAPFSRGETPLAPDPAIDYLGMHITKHGVVPKVQARELLATLEKVTALTRMDALAPATALQIAQTVGWPKVALGFPIALPDITMYVRMWHRVARNVFSTYDITHGAEIQRELGVLNHPVYWACKATITFYGSLLTTHRDPFVRKIVKELAHTHPIVHRVEALLLPTGVTWDELLCVPYRDLLRKAKARLREWSRLQIIEEAKRLNIFCDSDLVWREYTDGPARYLALDNARYGLIFRLHNTGPANVAKEDCFFCGTPEGDTGAHLIVCARARSLVPLPRELQSLSSEELYATLRLSNRLTNKQLTAGLAYLKTLWEKRRDLRTKAKRPPPPFVNKPHNPDFFRPSTTYTSKWSVEHTFPDAPPPCPAPPARAPRPRTPRSRSPRQCTPRCQPPAAPPATPVAASPSPEPEEPDIVVVVDEPEPPSPPSPCSSSDDDTSPAGPVTRSRSRQRATNFAAPTRSAINRASLPPAPPASALRPSTTYRSGKWTPEEDEKLRAAVLEIGLGNNQALSARVGSRSALQCSDRLRTKNFEQLLKTAQLPPRTTNRGGHFWTSAEVVRLEQGINSLGGFSDPAALSRIVGTRTPTQVAEKLEALARNKRIKRKSTGYSIDGK